MTVLSEERLAGLVKKDRVVFVGKMFTLAAILAGLPVFFHLIFLNGWLDVDWVLSLIAWFGVLCYGVGVSVERGWWF